MAQLTTIRRKERWLDELRFQPTYSPTICGYAAHELAADFEAVRDYNRVRGCGGWESLWHDEHINGGAIIWMRQ